MTVETEAIRSELPDPLTPLLLLHEEPVHADPTCAPDVAALIGRLKRDAVAYDE